MHLARKLFLFGAFLLATLALSAGSASAQLEFHNEDRPNAPCDTVTLTDGHDVQGGCVVEYESTEHIPLVAYTPSPVVVSNCMWHLEAQIGEDGEGYVTEADLTDEPVPPSPACTRQACDEIAPNHETLPWPIHVNEAAGAESIELRLCVRVGSPGEDPANEGGLGTRCTIHFQLTDLGGHDYELGEDPGEAFCEPGDLAFPVSFQNVHLVSEEPASECAEAVEIIH